MPQFALHRNKNKATRARFPLLLDIQSDLLEPIVTRVVIPLTPVTSGRSRAMQTLTPVVTFDGSEYVLVTPQLAGLLASELGPVVGNLQKQRATIIAALDFLVSA